MHKQPTRIMLIVCLTLGLAAPLPRASAQDEQLSLCFDDPVGDNTGRIDVTGMALSFDSTTGSYTITLTANAPKPFVGKFRVSINLYNPDTNPDESLFQDNQKDFDLATTTNTLTLTGTNPKLLSWRTGHRVATNDLPFGNPPSCGCIAFHSGVLDIPFGSGAEDSIAAGDEDSPVFSTIGSCRPPGQQLSFSFNDPVGDQTGRVDLTRMVMNFDSSAATYTITLTSDALNPFVGKFRVNINLYNPDTNPDESLFKDNQKDFDLATATNTLTLTGTNFNLLSWRTGHRVATNDLPFGNPPRVLAFRMGVTEFNLEGKICNFPPFCEDNLAYGADGFTTIGTGGSDLAITGACKGDGKQLVVNGAGFVDGAKVFLNGGKEKTRFVSSTQVIALKSGKRAVNGDTLKVRNPDNSETPDFSYTQTNCPP